MTPETNLVLFAVLLTVIVLVFWSRIGGLRDRFDELKKLLLRAQGVALADEMDQLRHQLDGYEHRITELERVWHEEHKQFLDVNERVLKAMRSLEERFTVQQRELAVSIAAEIRAIYHEDVRRIVTQRFHELNGSEDKA